VLPEPAAAVRTCWRRTSTGRGDLALDLVAPDATVTKLKAAAATDHARNLDATYDVNVSSKLRNGVWKLRVRDAVKGNAGVLVSWTLTL
jgi:serine protease